MRSVRSEKNQTSHFALFVSDFTYQISDFPDQIQSEFLPPALISNCYIAAASNGCNAIDNFTAVGRVSGDGHYTPDLATNTYQNYPNFLCCKNFISMGKGEVSFRYSAYSPPYANGSGMVSVNSTNTYFSPVRLGFPKSCFLAQNCDSSNSEICVFKVSNSSSNPFTAESSHIADCTLASNPVVNNYPNRMCCKFDEICDDGIDNDFDGYIDCADQDCSHYAAQSQPEFCTGSPYNTSMCVNVVRYPNGTVVTNYNSLCYGQDPNLYGRHFYCSYGMVSTPNSPGLCCPEQTYAAYDPVSGWRCDDSELCGIDNPDYPCAFDFDLNNTYWRNSRYTPGNSDWCHSKMPYLYDPDPDPYPNRSDACCLIAKDGTVDYFTDMNNVKIYGYAHYCGDGILDPGEQCEQPFNVVCNATNFRSCQIGYAITGNLTCTSSCRITNTSCSCIQQGIQS